MATVWSLLLQAAYYFGFLIGQDFRFEVVDAKRGSHSFGRAAAVAREHDDPQSGGSEIPKRLRRRWFDGIGDAQSDPAGRPSTATKTTMRPSVGAGFWQFA